MARYANESVTILKDDRITASICHISGLLFLLLPFFGHVLGPLLVWLFKRHESDFIDRHGREAINFQISVSIYAFAMLMVLLLVGTQSAVWGIVLFFLCFFPLILFWLISMIVGVIRASDGETYRYPLCIRLIDSE